MRKILPSVLAAVLLLPSVRAEAELGDELRRPTVEPIPVTAAQLLCGKHDYEFVRIEGAITDLFRDEDDQHYRFFIIQSDGYTIYAPSRTITASDATLRRLVGAQVSVCGTCDANLHPTNPRRQVPRTLYIWNLEDIKVLKPAPENPYAVDEIGDLSGLQPADLPHIGRRRTSGKVLAVWDRDKTLIMTRDGRIMRIELSEGPLPATDAFIETVGIPETDVYHVNLTRADWRPTDPFPVPERPVTNLTTRSILSDRYGREGFRAEFHGRTIRLRGIVRSLATKEFHLEDDGHLVPVDATSSQKALTALEVGCTVEVTGICVLNVESWRPSAPFPRIKGFTLVPRTADDIAILSRPPWWTPQRLLTALGIIVLVLTVLLVLREQLGRIKTRLKVNERTRLAVELHDSLAQNLSGITFEINAADRFADEDPAASRQHLNLASRILRSCREELRNCIWELRSRALEADRMDDAIRQTLTPHIGTAALRVRFNVPRRLISDNTAHALLRIVRELASNAVRHGHASQIRIAGALDEGRLLFSVADNGCGFDPESRPGIEEGHFGLQGVRERVEAQDGTMEIESHPGGGAKITIAMQLRTPEEESRNG